MSTFRVLICSDNIPSLQQMIGALQEIGLDAWISPWPADRLHQSYSNWDVLIVDVKSRSCLLRQMLPTLQRRLPSLTMTGLMSRSSWEHTSLAFGFERPLTSEDGPENVILMFPQGFEERRAKAYRARCETVPWPSAGLI